MNVDDTAAVFVISVAAELAGMHPQTLRQYDRLGLVSPSRASGRGRRYSTRDIEQLREVQRLSQDEGVSLSGIKRILELENELAALRGQRDRLADELAGMKADLSRLSTPARGRVFAAGVVPGDIVSLARGTRPARRPGQLVVWRSGR